MIRSLSHYLTHHPPSEEAWQGPALFWGGREREPRAGKEGGDQPEAGDRLQREGPGVLTSARQSGRWGSQNVAQSRGRDWLGDHGAGSPLGGRPDPVF